MTVGELNPEHGIRERLDNAPFDLDGAFFFRHSSASPVSTWICWPAMPQANKRVYVSVFTLTNGLFRGLVRASRGHSQGLAPRALALKTSIDRGAGSAPGGHRRPVASIPQ